MGTSQLPQIATENSGSTPREHSLRTSLGGGGEGAWRSDCASAGVLAFKDSLLASALVWSSYVVGAAV